MKFQTIVLAMIINIFCFGSVLAEPSKEDHAAHHPATEDSAIPLSTDKSVAKEPAAQRESKVIGDVCACDDDKQTLTILLGS